jgi:competence protein ComEA
MRAVIRFNARRALNAALVVAAVVALAIIALRGGEPRGVEVTHLDPRSGIDEIRVDVSGAVSRPSVVTVERGGRVIDAIELAGGLAPDADTAALNLARRVVDEDRVVVPRLGEAAPLLDLNTATAAELEALPGIGSVYRKQILDARANGPFTSTDELIERADIPEHVYERLRDLIATP